MAATLRLTPLQDKLNWGMYKHSIKRGGRAAERMVNMFEIADFWKKVSQDSSRPFVIQRDAGTFYCEMLSRARQIGSPASTSPHDKSGFAGTS